MEPRCDLSLTLPLFNEGEILQKNLYSIYNVLHKKGKFSYEIILIDDCSTDRTPVIAKKFADEHSDVVQFFQHKKNLGRGGTVADGFNRSKGDIVGFIDVDCEASPIYILDFVPDLLEGRVDGITGLRIYPFQVSTWLRSLMSLTYRHFVYSWLGVGYKDRQAGYKFFRKEKIVPLLPHIHDAHWFWDTEIMVIAHLAELNIEERPILFFRDASKKSTVKLFRDSINMIIALVRYRRRLPILREALQHTLHSQ